MYTPWSVRTVGTETLPVVEPLQHEFFSETPSNSISSSAAAAAELDPRSSLLESLEGDLFHNLFSSFSTSPPTNLNLSSYQPHFASSASSASSLSAQFVFPSSQSPYPSAPSSAASSVSSSASSSSSSKRRQRSVPRVAAATKGKLVKKKQPHGKPQPLINVKKPTPSEDEEEEDGASNSKDSTKDSKDKDSKRGKLGIACEFCRERHISCIMQRTKEESPGSGGAGAAPTSWSCSNCRTRGIKCVVVARRKRGPKPKSLRGELKGEGGNHFNNLTSTFTYIPSSVPPTSSSSSSSSSSATTSSAAIPSSYLSCLSIQGGGSPGERSPGVSTSTSSPSSSTMTPSSSSSSNNSPSSSSSSTSPWPTSTSPSFTTTPSSTTTATATAIPPPTLPTGFYRTATNVPSSGSATATATGLGSGFSSSTIPATPTSVASSCTSTAPAPSEFPPAAPPPQPEMAITSSSSPTLYDHASLILKIHPLPVARPRGPDAHYPSYFPFDDYVAMYRAGNLQDCGMVHPDKIAALGHPSAMLVNDSLEGRMKKLIVVSSLVMGAASLRHMDKAYSLYLQALQLADEPRPWRTRYIKSASIPNPILSAGFIPDYYSPGSLEEELRQLKQDKQLCRALVQLTTATRYVEWSQPQRAALAGACFECATVMLKRCNRVSRQYSIPVPESVKRVTLSALMLSYTCFDSADRIRCQELLLSIFCSNPSRISWSVAHPQRPAALSNNPILAMTPSPVASRKFPTEFRMWVLTSAILQDIFDIFCTIQHQSSSSGRRSPPTCPPASSFNSKTTTSSSGFAPRYAAPRELERTSDWGMDDMTTGYDVDFSQGVQVPRTQLNVIFFTDRERCMRLHRLLLEIQDLHSLLNLEGLASRTKLNSWKGCIKAFESVLLWLMGKRYSFVEKQQQSLKALENQSLSPPLGPTTISYLILAFASHVHRAQTAELQSRLNEFPGIKTLSSEFWEGKLSANSWLTTRHSTSIRLTRLHSDLQLAFG